MQRKGPKASKKSFCIFLTKAKELRANEALLYFYCFFIQMLWLICKESFIFPVIEDMGVLPRPNIQRPLK